MILVIFRGRLAKRVGAKPLGQEPPRDYQNYQRSGVQLFVILIIIFCDLAQGITRQPLGQAPPCKLQELPTVWLLINCNSGNYFSRPGIEYRLPTPGPGAKVKMPELPRTSKFPQVTYELPVRLGLT